jgi:hypothetical protein
MVGCVERLDNLANDVCHEMSTLECIVSWGFFFKLIVGNNFDVISIVKHAILPLSHKVAISQKMGVGYILKFAKVIEIIMRCGKWM